MHGIFDKIRGWKSICLFILYRLAPFIPDKVYLRLEYRIVLGRKLNLKYPVEFSEKLQWLKIYNRKPLYTIMVDKYAVKSYVSKIIGPEYIIPTLGVWDKFEDIDFTLLPNQFVLKTTHGGGSYGVWVCKDKSTMNYPLIKDKMKKAAMQNAYLRHREWPYKNVERRFMAEQFIEDTQSGDLKDYKFFCFNGIPRFCQVIGGRETEECIDFFDMEWNHQEFHEPKEYPFAEKLPTKPLNFDKMIELAKCLAKDLPFIRVDFYNINGRIYFGEYTFFPTCGLGQFEPKEYGKIFGDLIVLPDNIQQKMK